MNINLQPSKIPWSGTIVCLSAGGWYPAAVFENKDDTCGFIDRQTLNGIDYIGPHLANAIDGENFMLSCVNKQKFND